jgi:pimeloyl-ACP methyl ester carboxylesterase
LATFVLVGGAWLGGWCWRPVATRLRQRGHDVYPLSLSGLGERAHLARPDIDLETHVADIVNLLAFEDLRDAILVGHSYGGVPVTGAADRAADRLARVVYVDAAPIPDGVAYLDASGPEERRFAERLVKEQGDGWRLPMPSWEDLEGTAGASLAGLGDAERGLMRGRAVPHPFRTWTQPLRLANVDRAPLPKLAILNSFPEAQVRELIASGHPMGLAMSGPEWSFVELPTGHWPMFSVPDQLADALHDAAGDRAVS